MPAFNEEDNLDGTLKELRSNVPSYDILVVDDSSSDATELIAKQNGIKVARLPFNLGIGGAVQTGFKYALYHGYDVVVQVDADGQHDPSFLLELVDSLLTEDVDIVVGSRYLADNIQRISWLRHFGIKYFSWITSRFVGQRITDCTSGFRAINKKAIEYFSENYPVDFPDAEALVLAHSAGLKISELPIPFRMRRNGKSSLKKFRFFYYPIKEMFSLLMLITKRNG